MSPFQYALCLLCFTLLASTPTNSFAQLTETRSYPVYRLKTSPTLDGVVSDNDAWASIPRDRAFVTPFIEELASRLPAYKQTSFKAAYDDDNLYVIIFADEPWTRYLNLERTEAEAFEVDDGVEVVLKPQSAPVQRFVVNADGRRWRADVGSQGTDIEDWNAKTSIAEDGYIVEIRIPFASLGRRPQTGETWGANIIRNTVTIISPEDRKTFWSPTEPLDVDLTAGRFVFKGDTLSVASVSEIEAALSEAAAHILSIEDAVFGNIRIREERLARAYQAQVDRTSTGFRGITRGPADLIEPPTTPPGEVWRYGVGFPLQVSPTTGALLTNIRLEGSGNIDFEIGTDVVLFDDLDNISASGAIPVSRYERYTDPVRGNVIVRKGPIIGGFVPLGAILDDGKPHPAAGTGFGICWAIAHEADDNGLFDYTDYFERYAMLYQFAYDGDAFEVLSEKKIDASTLLPDWNLVGNFVTNAIPDGEDLLYVMLARVGEVSVAGYSRWKYDDDRWRPVSFTPVTGYEVTWSEPSLIRGPDGSLLFSARSYDRALPVNAFDIAVWQSVDDGITWDRVVYEKNRRARSPVSINRAADGTPFVAANTPPLRRTREVLSIWPLDSSGTGLAGRITARDAKSEFGAAPSGSWWRIDHPTSAVIRLADGKWHSVLAYRIVDNGEVEGNALPAPQTGCYVEEVLSAGEALPAWRFE